MPQTLRLHGKHTKSFEQKVGRNTRARPAKKDPIAQQLSYRSPLRSFLSKIRFELLHLGLEVAETFQSFYDTHRVFEMPALLIGVTINVFDSNAFGLCDRFSGLRIAKADSLPFFCFQNSLREKTAGNVRSQNSERLRVAYRFDRPGIAEIVQCTLLGYFLDHVPDDISAN